MKKCRDCQIEKEDNCFIRNKAFSNGYDTLCVVCNRKRVKAWRLANPEKRAIQIAKEGKKDYSRSKHYRANYGITLTTYNEMFAAQQGCCYICGDHQSQVKKRLSVDHNHTTGQIRKLLCQHCNTLLGMAKEDTGILENAAKYLHEYRTTGY